MSRSLNIIILQFCHLLLHTLPLTQIIKKANQKLLIHIEHCCDQNITCSMSKTVYEQNKKITNTHTHISHLATAATLLKEQVIPPTPTKRAHPES